MENHSTHIDVLAEISNPLKDLLSNVLQLDSHTIKQSLDKKASPVRSSFSNLLSAKQWLEKITMAQEELNTYLGMLKKVSSEYEAAIKDQPAIHIKNLPNFEQLKKDVETKLGQLFQCRLQLENLIQAQTEIDQTFSHDVQTIIEQNEIAISEENKTVLSILDNLYQKEEK